jgi:site-specific recombinase XerD
MTMKRKGRKLPEILTVEEVKNLLNTFNKRYDASYNNYIIIRLQVELGLRISEVLSLTVENIERMSGKVMIKEGKGMKDRVVYMNQNLLEEVNKFLDKMNRTSGLVVRTRTGSKIHTNNVNRMITTYSKKTGIEKEITSHNLRHTYATHLLKETGNLSLVQKVLGHEHISTTQIYVHLFDKDVEEGMNKSLYNL